MELLIPKTLRGWIVRILVLILTFVSYYVFLFPYLERFYRGFLYTEKPKGVIPGLTVRLDSPDYLAPYGQRWLYFSIRNDTDRPISDLWIGLEVQRDGQAPEGWIFPFLYGGSISVERSVHIKQLQPGLPFSGRLPLFGSAFSPGSPILTVTVIITSPEIVTSKAITTVSTFHLEINSQRYLAHSFIEQMFLPPWSNGVMVAMVFIVCSMLEQRFNSKRGGLYSWLFNMMYSSLMLLLAVGGVALVLPAMPWYRQDVNGFLVALFSLFFILYGCLKWALGINLPPLPPFLFSLLRSLENKRAISEVINKAKNVVAPFRNHPLHWILIWILIWILVKQFLKPALPLLQPLPWIAFAVAVLRALDMLIHLVYSEGKYEPKSES